MPPISKLGTGHILKAWYLLLELTNENEENCREGNKTWQLKAKWNLRMGKIRVGGHGKMNVCSWVKGKIKIQAKLW